MAGQFETPRPFAFLSRKASHRADAHSDGHRFDDMVVITLAEVGTAKFDLQIHEAATHAALTSCVPACSSANQI